MNKQPVSYLQTDPRWGSLRYPTATGSIGIYGGGCGPTCCAMLISTLLGLEVLPPETMEWATKTGWVRCGDGVVSGEYFPAQFKRYGLTCEIMTSWTRAKVEAMLREGYYMIAGMGPGLWTRGGHFVVVWWADDKVRILDPASTADARTNGDPARFWAQVKTFYRVDAREYNNPKEDLEMTKQEFLESLTPEDVAGLVSKMDTKTAAALVDKAQGYYSTQLVPDWAVGEFNAAEDMGITDGTRPMQLIPRYQAAIMAKRAAERHGKAGE